MERKIRVLDLPNTWIVTKSELPEKEVKKQWLLKYQKQNKSNFDEISKKEKAMNKKYL